MSVFLLILKIIGIVLLVILGLIVVIALLALFCPFVYRVKGSYHGKDLQLQVRDLVAWPSAGALCRYRGRGIPHVCADFGFRKELHLQKEKEDSADFNKPVQEDSPQEGTKDRETEVAPSLTAMENTSQTSAQQLTDPEETILCHPDKKKKTFFRAGLQVLSGSSRKRSAIFAKDSLFFEKYTDILEKRNANVPEMVSFFSMTRKIKKRFLISGNSWNTWLFQFCRNG